MGFTLLINTILIIFLCFHKGDHFMDNMWIYYTIHYVNIFIYVFTFLRKNNRGLTLFFSPILFAFLYLGLSFTLGSFVIPLNLGFNSEVYDNFIIIDKLNIYTIYFFIADVILLLVWKRTTIKGLAQIPNSSERSWMEFNPVTFIVFFTLFVVVSFVKPLEFILLGFTYPIKLILIICLILISIQLPKKAKYSVYVLILFFVFIFHYHSKREIILVVLIFFFLESLYNNIKVKLNFKSFFIALIILFATIYLILAASIMRGYGSYKLKSPYHSFLMVPDYVQMPRFKHGIVDNFEINTVLGNTMICMDLVDKERIPLQYGGTYLKTFLSPIPRSIWPNKPLGMILKYTYTLNPRHKKIGQSLPVVHYAEGFANFYWLGIIIVVVILYLVERFYWYIITRKVMSILNGKLVFAIYLNCIVFQYIRGSGFDLFSLYALAPLPLILIINFLPKKKSIEK